MAVASLVVSIVALVIAGLSAIYSRQVARIEQARRHDERSPELVAELHRYGPSSTEYGWFSLRLTLQSSEALDSLQVILLDEDGLAFTPSQSGVDPSAPSPVREAVCGPVQPGMRAEWRVNVEQGRPGTFRAQAVGRIGTERWTLPLGLVSPYGR